MDQEFDDLKREFLAEAQGKILEVFALASGLSDANRKASLDRAGYLAHQLKGAGGSYGFQKISADASSIEKALEASSGTSVAEVKQRLEGCISSLTREISAGLKELGAPAAS